MVANVEDVFGGTAALLDLIGLIYASAQDVSLWPEVLERVSAATRGHQTFLFAQTVDPAIPVGMVGKGANHQALNEFLAYYNTVNPMTEPCDAAFADGDVRYSHKVLPDADLMKTEFYNDFFKRHDMFYSFGIKVPLEKNGLLYLSSQRSHKADPFAEQDGVVLKTLLPHLVRAFNMRQQMVGMQSVLGGVSAVLDAMDHAVVGLNGEGRITFTNRLAENLAAQGGVLVFRAGRVFARGAAQNKELQAFLGKAIQVGHAVTDTAGGIVVLRDRDGIPVLRAVATPSPEPFGEGRSCTTVLLTLHPVSLRPASRAALLRKMFGFTPVESRLAEHLMHGLELRECAEQMRVSFETARFHMKRLLAKTQTRKQADFIRLIVSLPGIHQPITQ